MDTSEDAHASERDSDDGRDQLDCQEGLPVFKPIYILEAQRAEPSAVVQDGMSGEAMWNSCGY